MTYMTPVKIEFILLTSLIIIAPVSYLLATDQNPQYKERGKDTYYELGVDIGDKFTMELTYIDKVGIIFIPIWIESGVGTQLHYEILDFNTYFDATLDPTYDGTVYESASVKLTPSYTDRSEGRGVRYDGREPDPLFLHTDWEDLALNFQNRMFSGSSNFNYYEILSFNVTIDEYFSVDYLAEAPYNDGQLHISTRLRYDKITGLREFFNSFLNYSSTINSASVNSTFELVDYRKGNIINSLNISILPFLFSCFTIIFLKRKLEINELTI